MARQCVPHSSDLAPSGRSKRGATPRAPQVRTRKSALADGASPRSIGGVGGRLPAAVLGAVGRREASAPGPTGARPPSPAVGLLAGSPANERGMQRHCTPRGARWGALFWRFARRGWHGRPASAGPLRPVWALGGIRRAGWRFQRRAPLPLVSGRRRPGRRPVSRRVASWLAACSGLWRGASGLGRLPFVPPPLLGCAGLAGGPLAWLRASALRSALPPSPPPDARPRSRGRRLSPPSPRPRRGPCVRRAPLGAPRRPHMGPLGPRRRCSARFGARAGAAVGGSCLASLAIMERERRCCCSWASVSCGSAALLPQNLGACNLTDFLLS